MRVEIQDPEALRTIPPASVLAHLRASGWEEAEVWPDRAVVLEKAEAGQRWEAVVPIKTTAPGYARNIFQVVEVLAMLEDRSQLDVFRTLASVGADTIRISARNGVEGKPVSLTYANGLMAGAVSALAAAARAAETPRPAFLGPRSAKVTDFIDHIAVAPSDFDTYELTLLSPVPDPPAQAELFPDSHDLPFSRLATRTLAGALDATHAAIAKAHETDALDSFDAAMSAGVSANFCSAVSAMSDQAREFGDGLVADIAWSALHPIHRSPNAHVSFSLRDVQTLDDASKHLRSRATFENEHILADVFRLTRDPAEFDGHAVLLVELDERLRRVEVMFPSSEYDTVIDAHRRQVKIELHGDLKPKGRGYVLGHPRNLKIVDE
ncbi:MAG: hypothetical protein OXD50_03470 [Chloroflexi bacterium]|nr:hypothetical protein [Chloroflexota bacterium]